MRIGLNLKTLDYARNKYQAFKSFHRGDLTLHNKPVIHGIELTNYCNLNCRMCNRSEQKRRGYGMMTMQNFKRIVDENQDCFKALALFFHGEPLLNPEAEKMAAYVKPYVGSLALTTNGTYLTKTRSKALMEAGLNIICISFEGPNKTVYEFVRRNGNYETVKQNILDALEVRKELGARTSIYLAYVLMDMTRPHVDSFRKEWMTAGINGIRFIPMHSWGGLNVNNNKELGDVTGLYRHNPRCIAPWLGFHVFWNGDVAPCCVWTGDMHDEHLGNILDKPIMEIWNGEAYQNFRYNMIHSPEKLHRCGKCSVEPYTNLFIDECEKNFPFSHSFYTEFVKEPFLRRLNPARAPKLEG